MADFADVFWKNRKYVSVRETEAACAQLETDHYVLVNLDESPVITEVSNEEVYRQNKEIIPPLCINGDDILSIPPVDNENSSAVEVGLVEIDVHTAVTDPSSPVTITRSDSITVNSAVHGGNTEASGSKARTEHEQHAKPSMTHKRVISHRSRNSLTSRRIAKNRHFVIYKYRCKDCWRKFHTQHQLNIHTSIRHVKLFQGCYSCKYCSLKFSNVRAFYIHFYFSRGKLFSCNICDNVLVTCKEYGTHRKTHAVQTVHQCSACNVKFKSKSILFMHSRLHERKYQYTQRMLYRGFLKQTPKLQTLSCSFCLKVFKNKGNLYKHFLIHSNSRCHICNICNKMFESLSALRLHKNEKHPNENRGQCEECGKVFLTRFKLYRHKQTHRGLQSHLCSVCGKAFTRRNTMVNHMKIHNNAKYSVLCQICKKSFSGRGHLMEHIQRKHRDALLFNCEHCDKKFPNEAWHTEHLYVHTGVKGFKCSLCHREFITHYHYTDHMKTHEKPKQKKSFSCDICGKVTNCLSRYERHKLAHIDKGTCPCAVCGKKFKHPYHLKRHLIYVHSEDKQYKCAFCSKSFRQLHYLQSHEINHSNTSKYVCKECGKEFVDDAEFAEHRKSHFKCRHCSESFIQKVDLILHEKSHKGIGERIRKRKCRDKQTSTQTSSMAKAKKLNRKIKNAVSSSDKQKFICSFCGKEMKTKYSLRSHMFIHKVSSNQCLYCDKVFILKPALLAHERSHLSERSDSTERKSDSGSSPSEPKSSAHVNVIAEVDMLSKLDASYSIKLNTKASGNSEEMQSADATRSEETSLLKRLENPDSDLRRHDKDLIGKRCDECGNFYSNEKQLSRHKLTHIRTRKFNCPICKKEFVENFHVTRHLGRVHKGAKPFMCKVCKETFGKEWQLREHTKAAHPDMYTYACTVCGQEFRSKSELTRHRFTHKFTTFQCRYCDKKFSWKGPAMQHEKQQHMKEIAGIHENDINQDEASSADAAGFDSNSAEELAEEKPSHSNEVSDIVLETKHDSHSQDSVSSDLKLVSDDLHSTDDSVSGNLHNLVGESNEQDCDDVVTPDHENKSSVTKTDGKDSGSLLRNYGVDENGMFSCNVCGKVFSCKRYVLRHIRKVHFCHRWFPCPLCDRSFKESFKVSNHIYRIHKGAKPYQCDSCGEKFAKNFSLRAHIRYSHPENHTFVCSLCGQEFRRKEDLRNHRFIHNESVYKCRFCSLQLSWKQAMTRHEASHMADKKGTPKSSTGQTKKTNNKKALRTKSVEHKCEVCNRIFTLQNDLDVHMNTHSTSKSHDCPLCGKQYETSMEVPQHIWKEHLQSKPFKCPHCTEMFNDAKSLVFHIKTSHSSNPNVNVNSLIHLDKLVEKKENGGQKTGITVKVVRINRKEMKQSVVTKRSIEAAAQKNVQTNSNESRFVSLLSNRCVVYSSRQHASDNASTLDLSENINTEIPLSKIPTERANIACVRDLDNSQNNVQKLRCQTNSNGSRFVSLLSNRCVVYSSQQNTSDNGSTLDLSENINTEISLSEIPKERPNIACVRDLDNSRKKTQLENAKHCDNEIRITTSLDQDRINSSSESACNQGDVAQPGLQGSYVSNSGQHYTRTTRAEQNETLESSKKKSSSVKCKSLDIEGEDADCDDILTISAKGSSPVPVKTRINASSVYCVPLTDTETRSKGVNKDERQFECSLCKNNFGTSGKLIAHLRDDHGWSIPSHIN